MIGHPFNPPHLIPLVEVVGGAKTSPDAVTKAMNFYREIGKHPIHIKKEVRGHAANRLQAALWREAIHLVTEGVVDSAHERRADGLQRLAEVLGRLQNRPAQDTAGMVNATLTLRQNAGGR